MKTKMIYGSVLLSFLLLMLTACWDNNDIEELSFLLGMGFDLPEEDDESNDESIKLTNQIASKQPGSESTLAQSSFQNISFDGESVQEVTNGISSELSDPLYTQHLKVVIVSDAIVEKYNLLSLLDQIIRDNISRLSPSIFITDVKANEVLNIGGENNNEIPSNYIRNISENGHHAITLLPPLSLVDMAAKLTAEQSFLLQNITISDGKVRLEGAGIIDGKKKKYIGSINEQEVQGVNWITGKKKGGVIKLQSPSGKAAIEIQSMNVRVTPKMKNEMISFDVKINVEGWVAEEWAYPGDTFKQKNIEELESLTQSKILKLVQNITNKLQNEFQTDVLGFNDKFRIKYPKKYNEIKSNWDNYFAQATVNYDVEATITNVGAAGSKK